MAEPADEQVEERGAPDPIEQAWARVEANWEDDEAHEHFVGLCAAQGRLPEAGKRYRAVRDSDPERSEEARRRIDRLLTLATRSLELTRSEPPDVDATRRKITFFALGLCLVLIGWALWAWLG
ncbi:MAG: hypothetical protein ACOCUS_01690 [Polyangiales bacterium]